MDYTQFVAPILVVIGGWAQWLRQYRGVHDNWIFGGAVALSVAIYFVSHPFTPDWRLELLTGFLTVVGYASSTLGGTAVTARLAGGGMTIIPMTNSK